MNYYRPPLVQLAVLDLQMVLTVPAVLSHVLVKWSPISVATASMSKSAQATLVRYGLMFVMMQSLPASCGLPVASLKSQPDSYGQLHAIVKSLPVDPSLQSVMP
ncbi:hypothetical protein Tco_0909543 [Tanacetum coccineum]|uniref:Uncharacterized protein n=1 Tax=Tanacetum coccineum TaxID=301880 RepID=A0ABQ5CSG4_9ASTR